MTVNKLLDIVGFFSIICAEREMHSLYNIKIKNLWVEFNYICYYTFILKMELVNLRES